MAFLDEIGKKISQTGQSALQKTKELADVTRLNGLVSDEERRINNSYLQVGKLYVSLHSNDFESDFSSMIGLIKESEMKIEDYKHQIQTIRGVKRCLSCGAEVAADAAFCNSCGTKTAVTVQAVVDENLIQCRNCNKMVKADMKFCVSCGSPISEIDSVQ